MDLFQGPSEPLQGVDFYSNIIQSAFYVPASIAPIFSLCLSLFPSVGI